MSTDHANLAAALAAFQADMPVVAKSSTATIPGKDGRSGYSYKYADLADVTAAAMPLLSKHGLSFSCLPTRTENGSYELVGKLLHSTGGDPLTAALPLAGRQAQEIGSSLTYMRRYLLGCMTGIVTDEDEDGTIAAAAQERVRQEPGPVESMVARVRAGWNTPDTLRALRARIAEAGMGDVEVAGPGGELVAIGALVADRLAALEHAAENAAAATPPTEEPAPTTDAERLRVAAEAKAAAEAERDRVEADARLLYEADMKDGPAWDDLDDRIRDTFREKVA